MSVFLGQEVIASGRDENSIIVGHNGFHLASVTAGFARELKQGIMREEETGGPAHAEVFGRKTKSISGKFAKSSIWIIAPSNITPED